MKNLKYIVVLVLILHTVVGCQNVDFGDLNKNTNGPGDPYPAGLLSGAIMRYATYTGRDGLMKPTLYVQYQAQVTYVDEMLYASVSSSWYRYYVDVLSNLQLIIDYVSDEANHTPELISQGDPANQIGVAMIFKAVVFKRVTDTWGDVPFTDALKSTEVLTPAYDSQENIYKSMIEMVKSGRDMLDGSKILPTGDIIYDGDVDKWKKFANSFILQLAIQLSKRYPGVSDYAATEFKAALNHPAGVIEKVDDEAWFKFEDEAGFRNPWNANRTPDYFMSKEFTDALQGNPAGPGSLNPTSNHTFDSRYFVYSDDPTGTGEGVPYGYEDGSGAGKVSVSNDNYWNNTTPLPLLTASYTYLNRAEAALMGWSESPGDVPNLLYEGIVKSYETLDYHFGTDYSDDADAYALSRVADIATAPDGAKQVIGEEKWVSLFGQGFDAWAEWRRTGYPNLIPATDYFNDGQIPRRYIYPSEEATLNGANYTDAVSRLTPGDDQNTARVWWDVM